MNKVSINLLFFFVRYISRCSQTFYEPRREKKVFRFFRSGTIQTWLYSHRQGLNFKIELVEGLFYLCTENKGADKLHS